MILSSEKAEVGKNGVNSNREGSGLGPGRKRNKESIFQSLCWELREKVLNSRKAKERCRIRTEGFSKTIRRLLRWDIKKRWQEYIEKLYKKGLHDPDNNDGVITDLEPDILECEVKWALGSITTNKASGGDGIPVKRFQILKDDAVKVLHSICQWIRKTQQCPQDWLRSVFIPIPKKGNAKECSNYHTLHSSHTLVK